MVEFLLGMFGIGLSMTGSSAVDMAPSNPPSGAILDHDGSPIHDSDGDFILEDV